MTEYKFGSAKIRVHGSPDPDRIREASMKFLKAAEQQRRKARNEAIKKANQKSKASDQTMAAQS